MMPSGQSAKVLFDYEAEQEDELTMAVGEVISNIVQEDGGWWRGEINGRTGVFPENFVAVIKGQPGGEESTPAPSIKALVKFDYDPEQIDEMQLREGEIIEDIEIVDEGWWRGKCNGRDGMFPSNFVEKIEASKSPEPNTPSNKPLPTPDAEVVKPPEAVAEAPQQPAPQSNVMASLFSGIKPGDARNRLKKVAKPQHKDDPPPPPHETPFQHDLKPTQMVPPMHVDQEDNKKKVPLIPPADLLSSKAPPAKPVQKAKALYDYEPEQSDELRLTFGMIINVLDSELTFDGWMKGEVDGKVGVFPDNFVELIPLEQSEQPIVEVKEEATPKPQLFGLPPPMLPQGGGFTLQSELAKRLTQRLPAQNSPSPPPVNNLPSPVYNPPPVNNPPPPVLPVNNPPLSQPKSGNKHPPPPLPGNKPSLPGTKPKPGLPHGKPVKPPFIKQDNKPESSTDVKPPVQNQSPIPKPEFPKAAESKPPVRKQSPIPKPEFPKATESKPPVRNQSPIPKPEFPKATESKPPNVLKTADIKEKAAVSASANSPPTLPPAPNLHLHSTPPAPVKDAILSNGEVHVDEEVKLQSDHSKLSAMPSLSESVRPTDALKHFDRVKPPGKSPPSKFKDKHADTSPPPSPPHDPKELNELKQQVVELQSKMLDMEKKFKKLLTQVNDDLDSERKLRLGQQVEIDSLKKKLDVVMG